MFDSPIITMVLSFSLWAYFTQKSTDLKTSGSRSAQFLFWLTMMLAGLGFGLGMIHLKEVVNPQALCAEVTQEAGQMEPAKTRYDTWECPDCGYRFMVNVNYKQKKGGLDGCMNGHPRLVYVGVMTRETSQ